MCGDLGSPLAPAPHTASAILFAQPPTPSQEPICPVYSYGPRSWNHGSQSRIQMSINIISMFGALDVHVFVPWTQQFPLFGSIAHRRADSQSCYWSMRDGCKHLSGMWMYFVHLSQWVLAQPSQPCMFTAGGCQFRVRNFELTSKCTHGFWLWFCIGICLWQKSCQQHVRIER